MLPSLGRCLRCHWKQYSNVSSDREPAIRSRCNGRSALSTSTRGRCNLQDKSGHHHQNLSSERTLLYQWRPDCAVELDSRERRCARGQQGTCVSPLRSTDCNHAGTFFLRANIMNQLLRRATFSDSTFSLDPLPCRITNPFHRQQQQSLQSQGFQDRHPGHRFPVLSLQLSTEKPNMLRQKGCHRGGRRCR